MAKEKTALDSTQPIPAPIVLSAAIGALGLRAIVQLLRRATNVDFSHYQIITIRRRIIGRVLPYKLDSLNYYADYLRHHLKKAALLYDDLLEDPSPSRLDLVSCRYLLIYLDSIRQRKAIATFNYALNFSGYPVLGKAGSVGSSARPFASIEKNTKVFSQNNDVASRATFTLTPGYINNDRGRAFTQPEEWNKLVTALRTISQ